MAPDLSRNGSSPGGDPLTDLIRVHGLEVQCILGTYPQERQESQPIVVHLTLESDLGEAGRTGRLSRTVDYDRLSHEVAALLAFREYRLLETAAEECCAMVLGIHTLVSSVKIRIEKPRALAGRAVGASVEFFRTRSDYAIVRERCGESFRTLLLETQEGRLELWNLDSGGVVTETPRSGNAGLQWPVSGALSQAGRHLSLNWPTAATRIVATDCGQVVNEGPDSARLFRCWQRG